MHNLSQGKVGLKNFQIKLFVEKIYLQKPLQYTAGPYRLQIVVHLVPTPTQFAMIFLNLEVSLELRYTHEKKKGKCLL